MLQPPAEAKPGTSLPPLAFPPEQTEVKKHSAFRLGRLQFQAQPLLVQWGKNQVPETRMRAPASFSNAVPNLPGKSSRTEHALRRPLGLRKELCAGAGRDWRERRRIFRRWSEEVAGGVDDGCLAAREGWSFEESPSSGRSGAVAAGDLEALLPTSLCLRWTPWPSRRPQTLGGGSGRAVGVSLTPPPRGPPARRPRGRRVRGCRQLGFSRRRVARCHRAAVQPGRRPDVALSVSR